MLKSIVCTRVNHMNVVCENFDAGVAHLHEIYGAEFMADMPQREWHAGLVEMGRVIFELFVPHDFLLNARYGPHYVGVEYQADMDDVRAAIGAHGIRIARDIGLALHTHPGDCFGIAFEFYGGYFHDRDWPLLGGKIKSASYWQDEHPLGLTGLKGYTVAVRDIEAARAFFQSFLGGDVVYEARRPALAARAVGLQIADAIVELVTPVADGALAAHLERYGEGIRSTLFGVRSIEQAHQYLSKRSIATIEGGAPGSIAVPAEANLGVIFEFAQ